MSRENQAAPIALAAALLLRLGLTDAHLVYVKPSMRPWLLVAGFVLAALAVTQYVTGRRTSADEVDHHDHDGDQGDHAHGRGALPWLLALPFAAVVMVAPTPLQSFAAARQETRVPDPAFDTGEGYAPLPDPVNGAYELTLVDFSARAKYDEERQMEGETIRLTGFVTPAADGDEGFVLTRFLIACCAGDAYPIKVAIQGVEQPVPEVDTWLVVEGVWRPAPGEDQPDIPVLDATTLRQIPQPADPYEG